MQITVAAGKPTATSRSTKHLRCLIQQKLTCKLQLCEIFLPAVYCTFCCSNRCRRPACCCRSSYGRRLLRHGLRRGVASCCFGDTNSSRGCHRRSCARRPCWTYGKARPVRKGASSLSACLGMYSAGHRRRVDSHDVSLSVYVMHKSQWNGIPGARSGAAARAGPPAGTGKGAGAGIDDSADTARLLDLTATRRIAAG